MSPRADHSALSFRFHKHLRVESQWVELPKTVDFLRVKDRNDPRKRCAFAPRFRGFQGRSGLPFSRPRPERRRALSVRGVRSGRNSNAHRLFRPVVPDFDGFRAFHSASYTRRSGRFFTRERPERPPQMLRISATSRGFRGRSSGMLNCRASRSFVQSEQGAVLQLCVIIAWWRIANRQRATLQILLLSTNIPGNGNVAARHDLLQHFRS